jgi:TonB family protein
MVFLCGYKQVCIKQNKNNMKTSFQLLILVCTIAVWSCGTKTTEDTTDATENTTDTLVLTTDELSEEASKKEIAAAKRIALEKASMEKEEQRRLAAVALAETTPTYKDKSGKVIYNKAEVDPSFTGGNNAMKKYLRSNLKYPKQAEDNEIEGTVFVDFIVDQSGNVSDVTASDVVGEDVDLMLKDEAVRVVASMPTWIAGTQRGKAVDTRFSIPITFQLSN